MCVYIYYICIYIYVYYIYIMKHHDRNSAHPRTTPSRNLANVKFHEWRHQTTLRSDDRVALHHCILPLINLIQKHGGDSRWGIPILLMIISPFIYWFYAVGQILIDASPHLLLVLQTNCVYIYIYMYIHICIQGNGQNLDT